jgi:hypothetical protein
VKVFLSWSGAASKAVAEALHHWLPRVIQSVAPWMSAEDIAKGARWSAELANQLQSTRVGIICVTPDNANAPWLLFEAGALSKTTEATFVCPFLFKVEPTELTGPLTEFQASVADRDGTKRLVRTLNLAAGDTATLSEKQLDETFDVWWPKLEAALAEVAKIRTLEPRPTRTERDILKEILELVRAMTRRQSSVEEPGNSARILAGDLLRSLDEANSLLRADKGIGMSTQAIAGELAERLPAVLQKSAIRRKRTKQTQ